MTVSDRLGAGWHPATGPIAAIRRVSHGQFRAIALVQLTGTASARRKPSRVTPEAAGLSGAAGPGRADHATRPAPMRYGIFTASKFSNHILLSEII
ncbi:hypothetical protein [Methylobacterium sp. SyP6R]|uniref:hypothetical protein n=1 Tax=Methylobacterium sp. SyP6R TaxID=2718876 RepID=UPI001F2CCA9D|nr:hypothetical protein [Methylobacterium sp. SyP6R]MCF4127613.1 hypothetical protein [Methylobacterium sp. SyP6R]